MKTVVTKNLVYNVPIENDKKLYNNTTAQHIQPFTWEDVGGLSWLFINDEVI